MCVTGKSNTWLLLIATPFYDVQYKCLVLVFENEEQIDFSNDIRSCHIYRKTYLERLVEKYIYNILYRSNCFVHLRKP